jgi:integrase
VRRKGISSENKRPVKLKDARQRVVFHTFRHTFRHTFASWLVVDGVPRYTVAELMGHSTLEMTRRYSHLAPDTVRKAAMSLQGKLSLSVDSEASTLR